VLKLGEKGVDNKEFAKDIEKESRKGAPGHGDIPLPAENGFGIKQTRPPFSFLAEWRPGVKR